MTRLTINVIHLSPRLFILEHVQIFRIPHYQRKIFPICQISEPTDHLFVRDISIFSIIYCDVIRDTPFFSVETPISTQFKSDLWWCIPHLHLNGAFPAGTRSEEHTSELQSRGHLVDLHSFPTRRSSDLDLPYLPNIRTD